nr:probable LRR receptor-like serine/threonine-protein kinase At4g36180 [Ipomoea batatas]
MGFSIGIATLNHDYSFELSTNDAPPKVEFIRTKEIYIISLWRQHLKIDLSANSLIGEIPFELGNLTEIHALNLSYNNLSGMIPETFSKLENIESLDLSTTSAIPEPKAQFATFGESSYEDGESEESNDVDISKFSTSVLVYFMLFFGLE